MVELFPLSAAASVFRALLGLMTAAILMVGLQDILTAGFLSSELDAERGLHPFTFVACTLVFCSALLRAEEFAASVPKSIVHGFTFALTILLASALFARVSYVVNGHAFPFADVLMGHHEGVRKSSVGTLTVLFLLHVHDAYWPRAKGGMLAYVSYFLGFAIISLVTHNIIELFLHIRDDAAILDMPLLTSGFVLGFTGWSFVTASGTRMLFDPRTPTLNTFTAISLFAGVVAMAAVEVFVLRPVVEITLPIIMLLVLPMAVSALRKQEIKARIRSGALTQKAELPKRKPAKEIKPGVLPQPQGLFERLTFWATFGALGWQRLVIQAGVTFALAYGAIWLSRSHQGSFAMIWWANAYLGYCLLLYTRVAWFKPLATFLGAVTLANLVSGNPFVPSLALSAVNTIEGTALALAIKFGYGLRIEGRRVVGALFGLPRQFVNILFAFAALAITGVMGGGAITFFFGGNFEENFVAWFSGGLLGGAPIVILGAGKVIKFHMGYRDLSPKNPYFLTITATYLGATFAFFAFAPVTYFTNTPHMVYLVTGLMLITAPSLLWAGARLSVTSAIYYKFGAVRWGPSQWAKT